MLGVGGGSAIAGDQDLPAVGQGGGQEFGTTGNLRRQLEKRVLDHLGMTGKVGGNLRIDRHQLRLKVGKQGALLHR